MSLDSSLGMIRTLVCTYFLASVAGFTGETGRCAHHRRGLPNNAKTVEEEFDEIEGMAMNRPASMEEKVKVRHCPLDYTCCSMIHVTRCYPRCGVCGSMVIWRDGTPGKSESKETR